MYGNRRFTDRAAVALAACGIEVARAQPDLTRAPGNGKAAAKPVPQHGVDALVATLPGGKGAEPAARRLCEGAAGLPVVVIVASLDGGVARAILRAGVRGIVLSEEVEQALVPTVRAANAGQIAIPRSIRHQVFPPTLSARESTVLALVTQGRTNAQIASSLHLEESTVKSHLGSLFAKLGVRSREDAAAAVLNGEDQIASGVLAVTDQSR